MATTNGKVTRFIEVSVTIAGPIGGQIDGYDDGTSLSLAPQGDRNTVRKGNDAISTFAEVSGTDWTATLSLLESSDSNDLLSSWLESGLSQGVTFLDGSGRTIISSDTCRIRQYPTVTKSAGVESRSWDIHMINASAFVGGLNEPT